MKLQIIVDDEELEQNCFAYQGTKFNQDAGRTDGMKTRLAMGKTIMIKLAKTWKSKSIRIVIKLCLMTAFIWCVTI